MLLLASGLGKKLIVSDNGWEGEEDEHKPIKSRKCDMGVHKFPFMKTSDFFKQTAKWSGSWRAQTAGGAKC